MSSSRKINLRALTYFVLSTILAMLLGERNTDYCASVWVSFEIFFFFLNICLSRKIQFVAGLLLVCLVQPGADLEVIEIDEDDDNEVISTIHSISDLFKWEQSSVSVQ